MWIRRRRNRRGKEHEGRSRRGRKKGA